MEIELQRYAKREGNRESDGGSFVKWKIIFDEDNKKIIIRTEDRVYVKNLKESGFCGYTKIQLLRHAIRQGKRESDGISFVEWDIKADKDRIIIKTEDRVYVKNLKEHGKSMVKNGNSNE